MIAAARVVSVSRDDHHGFSKPAVPRIRLIEGFGVEGDVHGGATTQHRYLLAKDPQRRNLTQVHLIASELFPELLDAGFTVGPGDLGENVTTAGVDLIALPLGTRIHLGDDAIVEVTGIRSPCHLINEFQRGLMKACLSKDERGHVIRKAGIMAVVERGGVVEPGSGIRVVLPAGAPVPLPVV
ncbi:MOSC domain-containing protein [Galbitalea soli]|uniref:MOSC domain-containing protein n=1 Tax=Galbitalea soli TaxID=1268042 RepID=A0A7C9PLA1_9MICO|nr:MOSC domain-containing protein [Galbitalea soli]NEM90112.1 MOSC domain-containing protein [Galbitalea soli]NYJ30819.1 MOSC domain-containing protein YiiM [Galbitalea soli]